MLCPGSELTGGGKILKFINCGALIALDVG
jgi:hypothetical protein